MTQPAPHPSPRLSVHTPTRTTNAKLEVSALPGTVLGGPFCTGTPRPGCRRVEAETLAEQHLAYLRQAYVRVPDVKAKLDSLAAQHRYGRTHIAVYALDERVAENVLRAIRGLAARLPFWEALEAS